MIRNLARDIRTPVVSLCSLAALTSCSDMQEKAYSDYVYQQAIRVCLERQQVKNYNQAVHVLGIAPRPPVSGPNADSIISQLNYQVRVGPNESESPDKDGAIVFLVTPPSEYERVYLDILVTPQRASEALYICQRKYRGPSSEGMPWRPD